MKKYKDEVLFIKTGFNEMYKDLTSKDIDKIKKQIPNCFTLSRGTIGPLLILITFLLSGNLFATGIVGGLFATTDFFDGFYARKYNAKSEFGRILDPICDKIFVLILSLPLVVAFPLYIIPILALESGIALINTNSKLKGNNPHTIIIGKIKTFALSAVMGLAYISGFIPALGLILDKLFFSAIALQGASIIEYANKDFKETKKKKNKDIVKSKEHIIIDNTNLIEKNINCSKMKKILIDYKKELENARQSVYNTTLNNNENSKIKVLHL